MKKKKVDRIYKCRTCGHDRFKTISKKDAVFKCRKCGTQIS